MIRIFIPCIDKTKGLPGTNEMENWARSNRYGAAAKRKIWKKHVVNSIGKVPKFNRVWLDITYYDPNRRRDPDNQAGAKKYILDGIVAAGLISNDGHKQVAGWTERFRFDKDNPGVEVMVSEVASNIS
jgi:hypothetical protein